MSDAKFENEFLENVTVYKDFIANLVEITKIAKNIKHNIIKNKSNCKFIAERIIAYDVEGIQANMNVYLDEIKDFWTKTYKGFPCAVCDYDSQ